MGYRKRAFLASYLNSGACGVSQRRCLQPLASGEKGFEEVPDFLLPYQLLAKRKLPRWQILSQVGPLWRLWWPAPVMPQSRSECHKVAANA